MTTDSPQPDAGAATGGQRTHGRVTALVHDVYGPPGVLYLRDLPTPTAGAGEVVVQVRAGAIGPGDTFILQGRPLVLRAVYGLRAPRSQVRGWDLAGTVVEVGDGVSTLTVGDRVFGSHDGSLVQRVAVAADRLAPMPASSSFEEAAAVPESGLVALQGLRDAGDLQPGQRVLVNGAAGGIGTWAVQLATWMGASVTGVCSTRNLDLVRSLGADEVVDYTRQDPTRSDQPWDLVFDNVGNHTASEWARVLTPRGRLLPNSGQGGPVMGPLGRMARAAIRLGPTRRSARMFVVRMNRADLEVMADLLEQGTIRPVIDRTLPLGAAADGFAHVMGGHAQGKVVITL